MSHNIINPAEIELLVQELIPSKIEEIGSINWFENHEKLEKLRQQCYVEAVNYVEEFVKDVILTNDKLCVLVYEAICIQVWRENVLSRIFQIQDKAMIHGFIGYMILYHECTAVNFLQILLHHRDAVEAMGDEALDLIDYCVGRVVLLCNSKNQVNLVKRKEDTSEEKERLMLDAEEMSVNNGLASIAILSSISQYLENIPVALVRRLYTIHDVPILLASVMEFQPWKKEVGGQSKVFNDGQWTDWDPEELCKTEAQCWIALHSLLLNNIAGQHYEATEFRKQNLIKLNKYLHERVLDQIPPLVALKQFLGQLSMWNPYTRSTNPIILEVIPEITNSLQACGSKWRKLAAKHIQLMFEGDTSMAMEIAKRVAETYDEETLEKIAPAKKEKQKCAQCGKVAFKRCSRCHQAWYCGRECQVNAWPTHKVDC